MSSQCTPLSTALDRVHGLVTPIKEGKAVAQGAWTADAGQEVLSTLLDAILGAKAKEGEGEDGGGGGDSRWRFVLRALEALESLRAALADPGLDERDRLLRVRQQPEVSSLLQLVVALGIVSNLLPGVGLPPERRSAFFQCLKKGADSDKSQEDQEEVRDHDQLYTTCPKEC